MASKWTTTSFIRAFMTGTLGRKRVHGAYRVLDGDHCKVLVRASTQNGRHDGSSLIGINLSTEEHKAGFFHLYNTNCFTYSMNKDLGTYNAPRLPTNVLSGNDTNLLNSGIIDANDTEMLIELGDKPYLLQKKIKDGLVFKWESLTLFASLDKIDKRVASIEAARTLVMDPVGMEQLCGLFWIEKQPDTFSPPAMEEQYINVLSHPINPLDYGYKLEECGIGAVVGDRADGDTSVSVLVPNDTLLIEPYDQRAKQYMFARANWSAAVDKMKGRSPLEYKGLSTKKSRYGYGITPIKRHGRFVCTVTGVYVTGTVQRKDNWDDKVKLDGWYRLHAEINRVKLG